MRPKLKIRSVTSDGIALIEFSERLLVPNEIDESYLKEFAIRADVVLVTGQSDEDASFDWEFESFTPTDFRLKLLFDKAHTISQQIWPNELWILIQDSSLFLSESNQAHV